MFSPGIEPGTFCVLDRCDNRYTTKTHWHLQIIQPWHAQPGSLLAECARPNITRNPIAVLSRDRLVVRTLRCGRSNPGSNPGHGIFCLAKKYGLNRDLNPGPLAPKARIIPLDHWALLYSWWQVEETKPGLLHSPCQNFYTCAYESLYSSVAERWSCKPKVMSSILIGGKRFLQTQTS